MQFHLQFISGALNYTEASLCATSYYLPRPYNVVDGLGTALSVVSVGLAASGVGLLSTIIAVPVAIGIQAGAIVCELLRAGGKFIGRRLQAKARKHDQILVLAESKLNTIADRISTVLTMVRSLTRSFA